MTLVAVLVLSLYYNDLYVGMAPRNRRDLLLCIGQSHVLAAVLLAVLYYAAPSLTLGRGVLLFYFPLSIFLLLAWRAAYYLVLQRSSLAENIIVLGTGRMAQNLAREILQKQKVGNRILGFVGDDPEQVGQRLVNPSVIGTYDDLPSLCQRLQVDTVVVALEDQRGKLPLPQLLECKLEGVRIEEIPTFYEGLTGQIPIRNLKPSWLIFSPGFSKSRMLRNLKRISDFCLALAGLVVSFPILAAASILIWLESGRPIFYRQKRVGERGRIFVLYKLRTMTTDAEKKTGAVWASANGDPRITKVGQFLRRNRIDEIPQLINVIKGEMSFVGPRPERPEFVGELQKHIPYYGERHSVRPGITGWAQVRYGYGGSVEDAEAKLRYDLYYVKHLNPWLDIVILVDTAKVVLFGRGAR